MHYHFLSPETFRQRIEEGALLEYEEVYPDRFYGTLVEEVERATTDAPVLLDIEVNGARNVKRLFGEEALVIFIQPPSLDVLRERLEGRATEDTDTLRTRLERAAYELSFADQFDTLVVNDDLETAVEETLHYIADFLSSRSSVTP